MILRIYALARLVTLMGAAWILLMVFLSFVSIHLWAPPHLIWIMVIGFVVQLGLRVAMRKAQRP